MRQIQSLYYLSLCVLLTGCMSGAGNTPDQKRAAVQQMRNDVLSEMYQQKPDVRQQVDTSTGYAVFSNANVNLILASFGGGYGVLHDNRNGADTYLKMGELGVGFGAGVKDYRLLMIFHTDDALKRFMDYGVAVGAQADAAAVASTQGAAVGGELQLDNITVYQLTETGLALQATVKGTKYWPDDELN
ncbi:MAG TPA: YSC84-related protein [Hyphomicrobiales bacterium]|nr:YSC84-related protein [Hyphomicrobiales bacterium]